jgi:alkyldihydroxyacetonephosphate synthase
MSDGREPRRRSWWGWGWEDEAVGGRDLENIGAAIARRPGFGDLEGIVADPPDAEHLALRAPRVDPPAALRPLCSSSPFDRASHTFGKAFRDVVRALDGRLDHPPDLVAFPEREADVVALLDWCGSAGIAVIPFGGGSSVVGGVEARLSDEWPGVVSLDLTRLDRVVEVDATSRAARIQAGALGPVLEDQLRPHGYTLRHFPQSFEFSTLGGWLATRSGGHYATVYTHIDDLVESMRVVTPSGISESRRLPGSGAGPSPDRLFLGSEGSLGVITEAWMRVQDRVRFKASASARFATFTQAAEACRAVAQSGLFPTNCRVLDAGEATSAGVTDGSSVLLLGFESADHAVDAWAARAVELVADHGGEVPEGIRSSSTEGAVAEQLHPSPLRARRADPAGRDRRHVRDGVHVGRLPDSPCGRGRGDDRRDGLGLRRRLDHVPVHPRLPGRPRALLDGHGTEPAGQPAGAVGRAQDRGRGCPPRPRGHDHPPPRRRP